jgi:hypothetical protein
MSLIQSRQIDSGRLAELTRRLQEEDQEKNTEEGGDA